MNLAFDYFINRLAWMHFMAWFFLLGGGSIISIIIAVKLDGNSKANVTKLLTILIAGIVICTSFIVLLPNFTEADNIIRENQAATQQSYRSKE